MCAWPATRAIARSRDQRANHAAASPRRSAASPRRPHADPTPTHARHARHDPPRPATTRHDPPRPATTRHDPTRPATTRHDPTRPATTRHDPPRSDTTAIQQRHNPSRPREASELANDHLTANGPHHSEAVSELEVTPRRPRPRPQVRALRRDIPSPVAKTSSVASATSFRRETRRLNPSNDQ